MLLTSGTKSRSFSCGEIPNNIPYLARYNSPVYLLLQLTRPVSSKINHVLNRLFLTEIAPSLETDEITSFGFGFQQPGLQVYKQLTTIIDSEVLSKRSV